MINDYIVFNNKYFFNVILNILLLGIILLLQGSLSHNVGTAAEKVYMYVIHTMYVCMYVCIIIIIIIIIIRFRSCVIVEISLLKMTITQYIYIY